MGNVMGYQGGGGEELMCIREGELMGIREGQGNGVPRWGIGSGMGNWK